jgi:CTP:phosphocholine cytidylyltransferase-like protein
MASALVEMKEHISPVLEYCLTAAKNERLRSLALNAVEQMSIYCQVLFSQADTQLLFSFMQESYASLSVEHAQKLIRAAGNVASMLDD